jgi:hypothetical protein
MHIPSMTKPMRLSFTVALFLGFTPPVLAHCKQPIAIQPFDIALFVSELSLFLVQVFKE